MCYAPPTGHAVWLGDVRLPGQPSRLSTPGTSVLPASGRLIAIAYSLIGREFPVSTGPGGCKSRDEQRAVGLRADCAMGRIWGSGCDGFPPCGGHSSNLYGHSGSGKANVSYHGRRDILRTRVILIPTTEDERFCRMQRESQKYHPVGHIRIRQLAYCELARVEISYRPHPVSSSTR